MIRDVTVPHPGQGRRRSLRAALAMCLALMAALPALAGASMSGPDLSGYDDRSPDLVWRTLIKLDKVPAGITGAGVGVAVIDTGVADVPDLHNRVVARVDFTEERDGLDRWGHGTHMAGLVAGDGRSSAGQWVGVAPGANIIALKAASWNGATDTSSVIAALRWVVTNKAKYNIRVVNLSFGTDSRQTYRLDPLNRAVERAWEAGIVVVVSAGNIGNAAGSITNPGDDPRVLTVGAFDDENTLLGTDDLIPAFSSRGPTVDGFDKPDLVAPGVSIVSTRAPGSTVDAFRPAARLDAWYFKGTGTSQSAAIVSGVAALVLQANPGLTPDQVKGLLMSTTNDNLVGQSGAGRGAVNARRAVDAALGRIPWQPLATIPRAGTGLGTLEGTRGNDHVYADLNRDGRPELVSGERDVLGNAWDAKKEAATAWTGQTWPLSPWAKVAVVTPGFSATPAGTPAWIGAAPDADSWSVKSWGAANWDVKSWGVKSWGSFLWN